MKILVTGSAGYIGGTFSFEALKRGHEIIGIDNFSNSNDRIPKVLEEKFENTFSFSQIDLAHEPEKINILIIKINDNEIESIIKKKQSYINIINIELLNNILNSEKMYLEAEKKFSIIGNKNVVIHLIGPLQSNKVKTALKLFSTIQTIDRPKLVSEISKHLNSDIDHQIVTRDFYIQVNIGKENQKSGVLPNDLPELYDFAIHNKLKITGLMCIPPFDRNPSIYFEAMNVLKNSLNKNLKLSILYSMCL